MSSCVNARGIPTAAYQVLHLLTEVGYGLMGGTQGGVPPGPGLTFNGEGIPEVGTPPIGVPPGWIWLGSPPLGVD